MLGKVNFTLSTYGENMFYILFICWEWLLLELPGPWSLRNKSLSLLMQRYWSGFFSPIFSWWEIVYFLCLRSGCLVYVDRQVVKGLEWARDLEIHCGGGGDLPGKKLLFLLLWMQSKVLAKWTVQNDSGLSWNKVNPIHMVIISILLMYHHFQSFCLF